MILTTTNSVDGLKILEYKGIVSGIAVEHYKMQMSLSMKKYRDAIAESIQLAKAKAFENLRKNAKEFYVDAVVGIKVNFTMEGTCITVLVTGTAVSLG